MVNRLIIYLIILSILALPCMINAALVINEAMVNEPGDIKSLEWIEIYNSGDSPATLSLYTLAINDGTPIMLPSVGIAPKGYVVFCKQVISNGDTLGFESVWGNNSGVWGDAPGENYVTSQLGQIDLDDSSGEISLRFGTNIRSRFVWHEEGQSGVSWERVTENDTLVRNSIDESGSTPGRLNSTTPLPNDMAVYVDEVRPVSGGFSLIELDIVNYGLNPMDGGDMRLYYDNDSNFTGTSGDIIAIVPYPDTDPGDTISISLELELQGTSPLLLAVLPSDDRVENNKVQFRAFGVDYPPVVINEFLADPEWDRDGEWVELKNRSSEVVDLAGWYLGDENAFNLITDESYSLAPSEYVVLCKDSLIFFQMYSLTVENLIEPESWPTLNNGVDKVRLRDNYGAVVDSFSYDFVYGGDFTWGKNENENFAARWGRSENAAGSPGEVNNILIQASGDKIEMTVEPNPFSPSLDNETAITFSVPPGDNITLQVYDVSGRLQRTLVDNLPAYDGQVLWDGRDDDGRLLNVGMYILYLEVSGVEGYKQTIVIAP